MAKTPGLAHLGTQLLEAREAAGLTAGTVGRVVFGFAANVPDRKCGAQIYRYEAGDVEPSAETLGALAQIYGRRFEYERASGPGWRVVVAAEPVPR